MSYTFNIASQQSEFDQIHHLNYKTFVDEIPQHETNQSKILVDKFHEENTYLICCKDNRVIGMLAIRDNRPLSLENKLENLEELLPKGYDHYCEIRLLTVEIEYRIGRVFRGLSQLLARYCIQKGYDLGLISATTRQLKLYKQLGFQPFGDLVGSEGAFYQPMYLTKETFNESTAGKVASKPISFLPGPVPVHQFVQKALASDPIPHRSNQFQLLMDSVKQSLLSMTSANYMEVLVGTGTLANDVIAAQLSLHQGKGLILLNGEFGQRIKDHALRANLSFEVIDKSWGTPFSDAEIISKIEKGDISWLWMVHSETSTGMLNSVEKIKEICERYQVHLCLDCISSLGALPLDLQGVYLASGVSGKAIGSYTGLSFVFHQENIPPSNRLPRYLDLGMYQMQNSVPYSHTSNLMCALKEALKQYENNKRYDKIAADISLVRASLAEAGIPVLLSAENSSPVIITIPLPSDYSSTEIGTYLELQGIFVHFESDYLKQRNWIQIACLGEYKKRDLTNMVKTLHQKIKTPQGQS
ncbi:aminotransferase class V-fold PLP-dependent enzyme [Salipaludibacillus sp. CF4.18]|uniref:aminotransferase class V-fold PLP-dependent enzyme n=1 Tax=Salipaludibacillus sp. CF4.18 TaxID=3373081 RepID=UPI003EE55179